MKRLHFGFCQVRDPADIPPGSFFWYVPNPDDGIDASTAPGKPIVLLILPDDRAVLSSDARILDQWQWAKRALDRKGLVPIAISYGEEWYLGDQSIAERNRLRDHVARALSLGRRVFPHAFTVQIELFFNDSTALGPAFYAPVPGCDILAIDSYLHADGNRFLHSDLPMGPQAPYGKFYLEYGRLVEYAALTLPRQRIMLIAQAWHTVDGAFSIAPTPAQLRWWHELARRIDPVIAICYFTRHTLMPNMRGLDQLPELWSEVEWQMTHP